MWLIPICAIALLCLTNPGRAQVVLPQIAPAPSLAVPPASAAPATRGLRPIESPKRAAEPYPPPAPPQTSTAPPSTPPAPAQSSSSPQ
jgi:hypothetical protein